MTAWMQTHPTITLAIVWGFVLLAGIISFAAYVNANPDFDPDDYDDWDRP